MKRLTLTVNDLATLENALLAAAAACKQDADEFPALRAASLRAAQQYEALAERIAEADTIVVDT